jgi:hypothetical protein
MKHFVQKMVILKEREESQFCDRQTNVISLCLFSRRFLLNIGNLKTSDVALVDI